MVYYAEALFPGEEEIDAYPLRDVYPFPLFWNKRLSSLPLSDIVVLYGNNGSGKSTVLNIIGEALRAKRDAPLFDDTTYTLDHNVAYHPFSSFVKMTRLKVALDPYGVPSNAHPKSVSSLPTAFSGTSRPGGGKTGSSGRKRRRPIRIGGKKRGSVTAFPPLRTSMASRKEMPPSARPSGSGPNGSERPRRNVPTAKARSTSSPRSSITPAFT